MNKIFLILMLISLPIRAEYYGSSDFERDGQKYRNCLAQCKFIRDALFCEDRPGNDPELVKECQKETRDEYRQCVKDCEN